MSQLNQKCAKLVADYLMLPPEEQAIVFVTLSKYQQHQNVFQPFPLFAPISPQPIPAAESVWENKQIIEEVVKEAPKILKKKSRSEEYEPEPIDQFCIRVCDTDGCVCRYKGNKEEQEKDYIPELDLNGLYVFGLRRNQGYPYIARAAGLGMRPNDQRVRVVNGKGVAYVNLSSHEQAVQVYKNLRTNGVRVNWQKKKVEEEDQEEN